MTVCGRTLPHYTRTRPPCFLSIGPVVRAGLPATRYFILTRRFLLLSSLSSSSSFFYLLDQGVIKKKLDWTISNNWKICVVYMRKCVIGWSGENRYIYVSGRLFVSLQCCFDILCILWCTCYSSIFYRIIQEYTSIIRTIFFTSIKFFPLICFLILLKRDVCFL